MTALRNLNVCLVHERPDCVLDLVANLHHLDPQSPILLYNGGNDPDLLAGVSWERYNAAVHPTPRPMAWGRLHGFALDCMSFALQHVGFDTLTVVDSDQLALRPDYHAFLAAELGSLEGIGLLSSEAGRQGPESRIAPVPVAWREYELWRPWLRRFAHGETCFVHWSFWPSTVFTAAAARDLVAIFARDRELQRILERSRIWATEEVILPTVVALLGHRIITNPCCDDWVRFRTTYDRRQLEAAFDDPRAFWMHPVPRELDHLLRRGIRDRHQRYRSARYRPTRIPRPEGAPGRHDGLLLTLPLLERMRTVEGWLEDAEGDLLLAVAADYLEQNPEPAAIVEVGSYCGRATVLLAGALQALGARTRVYAVDPHDGLLGARDHALERHRPSLERLRRNLDVADLTELVEIVPRYAPQVVWERPVGLLFIDHLHDYTSVTGDFRHFESWLIEGGYAVFHDYASYWPGVCRLVDELVASGRYRRLRQVGSTVVLQKKSAAAVAAPARIEGPLETKVVPARAVTVRPERDEPPRRTLAEFRDRHVGETIVVCGCGASLNELEQPERFVTIGVNDVGRRFDPDYLVVVNRREQFRDDRFEFVAHSNARYLFSQLDLAEVRPPLIRFRFGRHGGTELDDPDSLPYTQNSPYVALCLAAHMGASRIGLIGVDFTEHHFHARTGVHPLSTRVATIDAQYHELHRALRARGVEVWNLSRQSRLDAFPRSTLAQFAEPPSGALSIVSYATTPVAGVPAVLARCIDARTPHRARCVWASDGYANGVRFRGDIQWQQTPDAACEALAKADLVVVHNGKIAPAHRALLSEQPKIVLAHNYAWNVDRSLVQRGAPGAVVAQYQALLPEFRDWAPVPNPLPWWEPEYRVGSRDQILTVAYTPSGRHERYPPQHWLYWHAKGYDSTVVALERLAARHRLRLRLTRERQVSHAEALTMKRDAHIVIDECVTGSYHRNSLEGLAAGAVVVNGIGQLPGLPELLRRLTASEPPFVASGLAELDATLEELIQSGPERLVERGRAGRAWLEQHWDFTEQWPRHWLPLVERALEAVPARRRDAATVTAARAPLPAATPCVASETDIDLSIVIPHAGDERLPQLVTCLAELARSAGAVERIVVELGCEPVARATARAHGARYLFVAHAGPFSRARALNAGSALAGGASILWLDNDLLPSTGFVARASAELEARALDYLIPYHAVRYLDGDDSRAVRTAQRLAADCRPVRVLRGGREIVGAAGLVRRAFLERVGGLDEGFRGWGGEDNAWLQKVRLLGAWGSTEHTGQVLHHLYHPDSGAHLGRPAAHPDYPANLARLGVYRACRDGAALLARFPASPHWLCPWDETAEITLHGAAEDTRQIAVAEALAARYGVRARALGPDARLAGQVAVVFGSALARRWPAAACGRTLAVLDRAGDAGGVSCAALLAADAVPPSWPWDERDGRTMTISLASPLSLLTCRPTAVAT